MLPNELFALACRAYYDEEGFIVDGANGQFAHSPLTRKECDTGYYLLWGHHQHQGLIQSKDLDKCCFFSGDTQKWLLECDYFPEGYFELWDVYDKYAGQNSLKAAPKIHGQKDDLGRSVHTLRSFARVHDEKDSLGKSLHAIRAGRKRAEQANLVKDESGKSMHAVKAGKRRAESTHSKKDEFGRSVNAVKNAKNLHKAKDELGRSVIAMRLNSKTWESTMDGFRSTAGAVANHNKARGWDPAARVRIS
jgi:hypothetical protein